MDTAASIWNTNLVASREHRGTPLAQHTSACLGRGSPNLLAKESHMTTHLNSTGWVGIAVLHGKWGLGRGLRFAGQNDSHSPKNSDMKEFRAWVSNQRPLEVFLAWLPFFKFLH